MINEEKVKHMTRMAIFEEEMGTFFQPVLKYQKKSYVSMMGLLSFLSGTAVFILIYGGIFAAIYIKTGEFSKGDIGLLAIAGVLIYAMYIVVRVHFAKRRAKEKYTQGKYLLGELKDAYETLIAMYNAEIRRPIKHTISEEESNELY